MKGEGLLKRKQKDISQFMHWCNGPLTLVHKAVFFIIVSTVFGKLLLTLAHKTFVVLLCTYYSTYGNDSNVVGH